MALLSIRLPTAQKLSLRENGMEIKEGKRGKAREHLEKAAKLVDACSYHRRDGELLELKGELGL